MNQKITPELGRQIARYVLEVQAEEASKEVAQYSTAPNTAAAGAGGASAASVSAATLPIAVASVPILAATAVPVVAGLAAKLLINKLRSNKEKPSQEENSYPFPDDVYNEINEINSNTVEIVGTNFDNIIANFFGGEEEGSLGPETKIVGGKHRSGLNDEVALLSVDPDKIAQELVEYSNERMDATDLPEESAKVFGQFFSEKRAEELRVVEAARVLRSEFHLTPKPDFKWSEKKFLGSDKTVSDIVSDSSLPEELLEKTLSDLSVNEWWDAFYKEDAEAGRINNSGIVTKDPGFQKALCRNLGVKTLSHLISPPNFEARRDALAVILGTHDEKAAQKFMIPGNARDGGSRTR